MSDKHDANIVMLAKASTAAQAHIWQNALEEEGIRCQVVGDYLNAGIGDIPGLRAEIWVNEEDFERARTILEAHEGSADQEEDQGEDEE